MFLYASMPLGIMFLYVIRSLTHIMRSNCIRIRGFLSDSCDANPFGALLTLMKYKNLFF